MWRHCFCVLVINGPGQAVVGFGPGWSRLTLASGWAGVFQPLHMSTLQQVFTGYIPHLIQRCHSSEDNSMHWYKPRTITDWTSSFLDPPVWISCNNKAVCILCFWYHHHYTTTVLWPFFRDYPGEPVPEENFWTLWCKGRLTEADTPTIRLGATPSGLTSAHLHRPPFLQAGCLSCYPTNSVKALKATCFWYQLLFNFNWCWWTVVCFQHRWWEVQLRHRHGVHMLISCSVLQYLTSRKRMLVTGLLDRR